MSSICQQSIPGGWSDREVRVGPHVFRLFTPRDPDELLDYLESPELATLPHLADPYWAKLWPAAPLLAQAVVRNPLPRGTNVLELGCGSGLVGIAALAAGLDVTFSDYVPLAVDLAVENAARNGFIHSPGMVLDWRSASGRSGEGYQLVLASDVTYDLANLDPLLNVLDAKLSAPGQAWFGDAGRGPAADFVRRAIHRGWSVSLYDDADRPATDTSLGRYRRIVLKRS
jgi:predicted nicotinamide N-methyase